MVIIPALYSEDPKKKNILTEVSREYPQSRQENASVIP
jgi:hypothetical protein